MFRRLKLKNIRTKMSTIITEVPREQRPAVIAEFGQFSRFFHFIGRYNRVYNGPFQEKIRLLRPAFVHVVLR